MPSPIQGWNPKRYAANAGYVSELGKPVLDLLEPKFGERILDLGCGDGALSLELARLDCAVVGIDSSEEMVAAARSLGVDAYQMDGAALEFAGEFDAVFSNATLHWIDTPDAVIDGVWRAFRRDLKQACPWFFPTPEDYTALLENAGFIVRTIELFARPTRLPGDVRGWLETFAQLYTDLVPESERENLISEIVEDLRDRISDAEGIWFADYVRLRFSAKKARAVA